MTAPCQPPDPHPRRPRLAPPPDATDCHFHIFGPVETYPYVDRRAYTPPDASVAAYRHLQKTLGLTRCVVVQASVYGTDNRRLIDAVRELGPATSRAVAVVAPDAGEGELQRLHEAGVRGVRIILTVKGSGSVEGLEAIAARIAPFGWHMQFVLHAEDLVELAPRLEKLPVPIVIDHMGHFDPAAGVAQAGFQRLLAWLSDGRCWVKISAAYHHSRVAPPYPDVIPFARALIAAGRERVVWGSDWPHAFFAGRMPNDGDLLDLLLDWTDDEATRKSILVDNPARLYGF